MFWQIYSARLLLVYIQTWFSPMLQLPKYYWYPWQYCPFSGRKYGQLSKL